MERKYGNPEEALNVAKQAMWLAWNAAGGPSGMGFMRDNPSADKEAVWKNAYNREDYYGAGQDKQRINADYVFGRMLKLRFTLQGATISHDDYEPRRDYQGWCGKYPTFASLFDAAEAEVLKQAA